MLFTVQDLALIAYSSYLSKRHRSIANDEKEVWYFRQSGIISNKILVANNGNFETEAQNLAMKLRQEVACVRTF